MDAKAEANIFQHFQEHTEDKSGDSDSHRFQLLRLAHEIIVMEHGEVKNEALMTPLLAQQGQYAHLILPYKHKL